jgi:hypothetical protein
MAEPPITVRAAHDSGTPNLPPTRYVVHCTAGGRGYPRESAPGTAAATARYFATQAAGGSAHYIHDAGGDEEHCVPENVIAWHAPPNPQSIGDEICGEPTYTREQWLSDQVWPAVLASAVRCREVCDRYGIPKVKLGPADLLAGAHGVCGHVDVSNTWHQSTHWDPGPNFPWDRYMAAVNGQEEDDVVTPDDIEKISDRTVAKIADSSLHPWALDALLRRIMSLQTGQIGQARQAAGIADALGKLSGAPAGPVDADALAAALVPLLVPALAKAIPGATEGVVETALRDVLGSLDTTS